LLQHSHCADRRGPRDPGHAGTLDVAAGGSFYSDEVIPTFLTLYGTMDDAVVDEGHFFVAADPAGRILREWRLDAEKTGLCQGARDEPPSIMGRLERDAVQYGLRELSLTATLSGVALYERLGYRRGEAMQLALNGNTGLACIRMTKRLEASKQVAA
jgi:hypothetical protein